MASQVFGFLKKSAEAKRWVILQIAHNLIVGGLVAVIFFGAVIPSLPLLLLGLLALPMEIVTSRKITLQQNLIIRRSLREMTSRAVALRFEIGGREEIGSLAHSISQTSRLENQLSKEVASRISILSITPIFIVCISSGFILLTGGIEWVSLILALVILLAIQSLRWFLLPKDHLSTEEFFPGSFATISHSKEVETEETPEASTNAKISRIKELRWTDCQLQDDESTVAFRWGLATAGRITGVVSSSKELREKFIDALIDPWSLEIGRVFIDTQRETFRADQIQRNQWQNEIGFISRAPRFASLTIEANLKSIKPRATRDRLNALLLEVGLESDLLPEGLSTKLEAENSLFSPSLRRKVALARVLLKDSAIVILDLSCQDSDEATEELLIKHMRDLASAGKVVILISEKSIDSTLAKKQIDLDATAPSLIPQVSV